MRPVSWLEIIIAVCFVRVNGSEGNFSFMKHMDRVCPHQVLYSQKDMKYEVSSLFFSRNCGLSGRSRTLPAFEMSDEKEKSGALLLIQSSPVLQEKRFLLFSFFL